MLAIVQNMKNVKFNSGCFAFYPAKNPLEQKAFWGSGTEKPQQFRRNDPSQNVIILVKWKFRNAKIGEGGRREAF